MQPPIGCPTEGCLVTSSSTSYRHVSKTYPRKEGVPRYACKHRGDNAVAAITAITHGLRFPEGPIAMPDGSIVLVEIERQTLSRVTPDGKIHVIARLGGGPNGAAMGPGGKIYVTNNGGLKFLERPGKLFPVAQADDYVTGSIQIV